jgi:hypothetical protein
MRRRTTVVAHLPPGAPLIARALLVNDSSAVRVVQSSVDRRPQPSRAPVRSVSAAEPRSTRRITAIVVRVVPHHVTFSPGRRSPHLEGCTTLTSYVFAMQILMDPIRYDLDLTFTTCSPYPVCEPRRACRPCCDRGSRRAHVVPASPMILDVVVLDLFSSALRRAGLAVHIINSSFWRLAPCRPRRAHHKLQLLAPRAVQASPCTTELDSIP